ncbi:hypothetical protein [Arcticibacterium luteifluviistationis]|nr:hypothetical protein [Arcticibacterium luteifluviistationis]
MTVKLNIYLRPVATVTAPRSFMSSFLTPDFLNNSTGFYELRYSPFFTRF